MKKIRKPITAGRIIILGFAGLILIGSLLLMLPISTKERVVTPFIDTLFTSTSAVCVTGLVVHDTATYWSMFGQSVILIMIQIGGMGVVTLAVSIAAFAGKKIGLMQRSTMQESISAPKVGGIVKLTKFILKITFAAEGIGAVVMAIIFCKDFGILKGIWYAVFHSISAFCNAGFDLMGEIEPYSSLTYYAANIPLNIIVMMLVVFGGIGFLTWDDIKTNKLNIKKYRMQTKVILVVSSVLIFVPAIFFFFFEYSEMNISKRILSSLFQSVTMRTAGFNTADISAVSGGGLLIMIVLMIVGGSPGSTAGGMKTTTLGVLLASAISVFRKKENAQLFKRRIDDSIVKTASALLMLYLTLFISGGIFISMYEELPLIKCLFETASAVGTVGISMGATPYMSNISHIILIILMFCGRVGGLTVIFAANSNKITNMKVPKEDITVG